MLVHTLIAKVFAWIQYLIDKWFGLKPLYYSVHVCVTKSAEFMKIPRPVMSGVFLVISLSFGMALLINITNYRRQNILFRQDELDDPCVDELVIAVKNRDAFFNEHAEPDKLGVDGADFLERMAYDHRVQTLTDECGTIETYPHSTLAEAAVSYAWFTYGESMCNNGTELYQAVHDAVRADNDPWYQSCDRGVTTAIMWSGAEDYVPRGDCAILITHFFLHKDLWQYLGGVDHAKQVGLEPGDILICDEHVMMYVGNELIRQKYPNAPADYTIVSASIGDQVERGGPGHGTISRSPACGNDLARSGLGDYVVFRYIGDYSGHCKDIYVGDVSSIS